MRVLHLNTSDDVGGASIAVRRLHEQLCKRGVDSRLLVLNKYEKHIENSYDFRELYLRGVTQRLKIFLKSKWHTRQENRRLSGLPKTLEPVLSPFSPFDITEHPLYQWADVIHLHWVSKFLDFPSFFKKNKKPIVWTLHDKAPFTGGPHCTTFFPFQAYQPLMNENTHVIKKALGSSNITIVSPSAMYRKLSEKSEILGLFPHETIYHGIDDAVFRPMHQAFARDFWGVPADKKILLFAASEFNRPLKGMDLLRNAILSLDREDIFLLTVGKDFPDHLGIPHKNLGLIRDERLMALAYAASDVFVSSSLEESFGLTIAEALSCGRPVVCFNVGAASELIQPGMGIICNETEQQALQAGIERVLSQQYDAEQIARHSQERLHIELHTASYQRLYEKVLKQL